MRIFALMVALCILVCSCTLSPLSKTPSTVTTTLPPPLISEDKAVAIASINVPSDIISGAAVSVIPSNRNIWVVIFQNLTVTKEELLKLGWQTDNFSSDSYQFMMITITIDSNTGDVIRKFAEN